MEHLKCLAYLLFSARSKLTVQEREILTCCHGFARMVSLNLVWPMMSNDWPKYLSDT